MVASNPRLADINKEGSPQPEEDPEIGTIKLINKTWDVEDIDSGGALLFNDIPTRECTDHDFAGEEDSLFYPPKSTSILDLTIHKKKLKCIDHGSEFNFFGNYDT